MQLISVKLHVADIQIFTLTWEQSVYSPIDGVAGKNSTIELELDFCKKPLSAMRETSPKQVTFYHFAF